MKKKIKIIFVAFMLLFLPLSSSPQLVVAEITLTDPESYPVLFAGYDPYPPIMGRAEMGESGVLKWWLGDTQGGVPGSGWVRQPDGKLLGCFPDGYEGGFQTGIYGLEIDYFTADEFASLAGVGFLAGDWELLGGTLVPDLDIDGYILSTSEGPFVPGVAFHGFIVDNDPDGIPALYVVWGYSAFGVTPSRETLKIMARAKVSGARSFNYTSVCPQEPDLFWEKAPLDKVTSWHSPLVNNRAPVPPSSLIGNNAETLSSPLMPHSESPFQINTPFNPLDEIIVKGAVTGDELYLNGSTLTPAKPEYTFDLVDKVGNDGTEGIKHLLSPDKTTFTGIGSGSFKAKVTDYAGDITYFERPVIVKTSGSPDINIYFPGGTIPYDYRWMSTDPSADANRLGGLDVQASSTINGNYDLSTFISGNKEQTDEVTRASIDTDPVTNAVIPGWSIADSTTAGIPATSQAFLLNDPTSISGVSGAKRMYFDSTKPTISIVTTTDNWATITTDAQDEANGSGIGGSGDYDTGDVFFKFVTKGATAPTTPVGNDIGWTALTDYATTFAALADGEYDLYVYAKDNATNRSGAIKANDEPIKIGPDAATITIKKTVVGPKGDDDDIFLINLNDNSTNALITSVALKDGETSSSLTLDIGSGPSKTIKLSEIIPMDYKSGFKYNVTKKAGDQTTISGNTITIFPGDTIRIEVENTFEPTGYFKAKDFVKNIFKS